MKIGVIGLWHLGSVTAGCLASLGLDVVAIDQDKDLIKNFKQGKLPVEEPGLLELILQSMQKGNLQFCEDVSKLSDCDIVWATYDTPVDDNDIADTDFVLQKIKSFIPSLKNKCVILVSSQLPVGSCKQLQTFIDSSHPEKELVVAYSPENLRLGAAIDVFLNPDRIIVGVDSNTAKATLEKILSKISSKILWMKVASAEMTKHAINAFLANSVVFINEISLICERVGADASQVEKGLKSEQRIGPKAYLKPGNAFAGGTLARDISYLIDRQEKLGLDSAFFSSISKTNAKHRHWIQLAVSHFFPSLQGITIAVLGLTYKAGTNTLRRSQAIEFCKWAARQGATINAFDPSINELPDELMNVFTLHRSLESAVRECRVVVYATSWPEFKNVKPAYPANTIIIDPNGFVEDVFNQDPDVRYIKIGKAV